MAMALSNSAYSVLCSQEPLSAAAAPHNDKQVLNATSWIRPWRGGFPQTSLTLRHSVKSSKRHTAVRVQAAKQTFSSFDDLLENSKQPVLVDFYATWCGPCQYMVPILENVSRVLKHKIRVVKIDTEKYPNIASRYNVQALPTFIIFRDGQPFDRLEGAIPADQLIQHIEKVLQVAK